MAFQYEIADGVFIGTTIEADDETVEGIARAFEAEDITLDEAAGALYGRILSAEEVNTNFDLDPSNPGTGHEVGEPLGTIYTPPAPDLNPSIRDS